MAAFVENGKTLTIVRVRRSNFQSDHLNPAATQRFIDLTHEGYRRSMPEHCGSMVKWAFTDEPAATYFVPGGQMPWTAELPRIFREQKGYDLIESLPSLLSNPPPQSPEAKRTRVDFFDVWSRLFQQAYLFPIRDWCSRYGLLSEGHFGGKTKRWSAHGYGHILRAMRGGHARRGHHLAAALPRPAQPPFSALCPQRRPAGTPPDGAHRILLRIRQRPHIG